MAHERLGRHDGIARITRDVIAFLYSLKGAIIRGQAGWRLTVPATVGAGRRAHR